MSYLVFARKYRPQRFEDVVAQEHVTRTIQNAVKNDRVGSGYLFCGPRGTGKTTTARILAKALNCVDGPTPTPCGECSTCLEIAAGTSLDVLEIDAASNTGVDDIRTLRENVRYLPTGGKKRIYIIDEVHRLSGAAFDALLKTLEEPPPHVIFIFATTEPLKVPETILSRTQRFDFKRVSVHDLAEHARKIARSEKLDIEESALKLLVRKADGSVRDALSLMDQIAAFAGDKIGENEVTAALGLVDRRFLFDFTTAVASHDGKAILKLTRQIIDGGVDVKEFVTELLEHFRILLILATDKEAGDVLDLGSDELAEYMQQADYFSVGDIIRLMKSGADIKGDIKNGLDERLVLDVAAVKMAQMEATIRFEDILEHLKQDARGVAPSVTNLFGNTEKKGDDLAGGARVHLLRGAPEPTSVTKPLTSRSVNLAMVRAEWQKFLAFMQQKNGMLASQLAAAQILQVKNNQISAVFPASGMVSKQVVEKSGNSDLITNCLKDHFGVNLSMRFDIDAQDRSTHAGADKLPENGVNLKKLVENSPRIKMLIDKVDGEIIGVKKDD